MSEITQVEAIQKALVGIVGVEAAEKVANLKGEELEQVYNLVYEQASYNDVLPEELTVKGIVQELYEFTESDCLERWSVPEARDYLYRLLDTLSSLLGIELEDLTNER
ncbi:hypothetical protein [Enterococcus casseliflavus]|uniref:hypothetical protein n=1 Tax=Enterococcus casseliflavus TaxID=37734 RepID=UPI00295317EC|nr:hypothetical protein [Enterococcus casseliflavus]MDV7751728.1 hypothetical protein [Enterococcus casseliflavus]